MKNISLYGGILLVALPVMSLLPGCGGGNGIVSPTATPTATATPTTTTTATATPTTNFTATPTPRFTATPTPRFTATPTPRFTATPTARPTATPTTRPTATPTPGPTSTPIPAGSEANLAFTTTGGYTFGTSPYRSTTVGVSATATPSFVAYKIGIGNSTTGGGFLDLTLRSYGGPATNGKQFVLTSDNYLFVTSAQGSTIGGPGSGNSGTITVQRSSNALIFTFKDVTAKSSNQSIVFNGTARAPIPVNG